jgi:hypothetical protein
MSSLGFFELVRTSGAGLPQPSWSDYIGSPYVLLRRAAIREDGLESMAARSGDVQDNSCSHAESLNCFGRFGKRPNESDQ